MCGICGVIGEEDFQYFPNMLQELAHRGPDGEGTFFDPTIGLGFGHRRLAVVDVFSGNQPMFNEDGTIVLVFNGEIYNHADLRQQLQNKGHKFSSDHSDSEVLVHGYEEWGSDLLPRLNGMFAFSIYDKTKKRLFFARDRFGEKPLYFAQRGRWFGFSSEINSLLSNPRAFTGINPLMVQKYFAYGYVPSPNTIFKNVFKVPPGFFLDLDISTCQYKLSSYWKFQLAPENSQTESDYIEEFRFLFDQSVKRRLMSDVPLGVFLSGGLDSTAVLASAQSLVTSPINTFTIGFEEKSFDETPFARLVATHFATNHSERMFGPQSAIQMADSVLSHLDEPFCDPSLLPTHLLSQFAREKVTVALSGDGGDELLAGYDPFDALLPSRIYKFLIPSRLHQTLSTLATLLPTAETNMAFDYKLKCWLKGLSFPASIWNPVWLSPLAPSDLKELFFSPLSAEELYSEAIEAWNNSRAKSITERSLEFYTKFYLAESILLKADRASMASSLEVRSVFLDNDLVSFFERLPIEYKYRNGQRKYILKQALVGRVPNQILERKKKGFGIPLVQWLRSLSLPSQNGDSWGGRNEVIQKYVQEHLQRRRDRRLFLWSCMVLNKNKFVCH